MHALFIHIETEQRRSRSDVARYFSICNVVQFDVIQCNAVNGCSTEDVPDCAFINVDFKSKYAQIQDDFF